MVARFNDFFSKFGCFFYNLGVNFDGVLGYGTIDNSKMADAKGNGFGHSIYRADYIFIALMFLKVRKV